jgi:predicted lipoprotein with Yx(FWY)xxD motif
MTTRPIVSILLLLGALTLVGCGGSGGEDTAAGTSEEAGAAEVAVLRTAETALDTVVVDADGRTVYAFDEDTPGSGESACSGDCLATWPPVPADSDEPQVEGVTGEVGTITRDDGTRQVTLDGRPLYLYAQDEAEGDVTGQGVGDVWWVVAPNGTAITEAPAPDAPSY